MGRSIARKRHLEILSLRTEKRHSGTRMRQRRDRLRKKVPLPVRRILSIGKTSCIRFSASLWRLSPAVQTWTSTPTFQQGGRVAVESRNRPRSLFSAIIMAPLERPFLAFETFHTSFPRVWFSCRRVPYRPTESDSALFYFPAGTFSCSFISNETDQLLPGLVATFRCNPLPSRRCNFSKNAIVIAVLHTGSPVHALYFIFAFSPAFSSEIHYFFTFT